MIQFLKPIILYNHFLTVKITDCLHPFIAHCRVLKWLMLPIRVYSLHPFTESDFQFQSFYVASVNESTRAKTVSRNGSTKKSIWKRFWYLIPFVPREWRFYNPISSYQFPFTPASFIAWLEAYIHAGMGSLRIMFVVKIHDILQKMW